MCYNLGKETYMTDKDLYLIFLTLRTLVRIHTKSSDPNNFDPEVSKELAVVDNALGQRENEIADSLMRSMKQKTLTDKSTPEPQTDP
jgi:hypothetical protein